MSGQVAIRPIIVELKKFRMEITGGPDGEEKSEVSVTLRIIEKKETGQDIEKQMTGKGQGSFAIPTAVYNALKPCFSALEPIYFSFHSPNNVAQILELRIKEIIRRYSGQFDESRRSNHAVSSRT